MNETFENRLVTYTLSANGKFYLVENVPARVCVETGEQLFAPEVVERLQQILWNDAPPIKTIETPIYEFAA
jgi:YgiT-type zinc finger domain-containing protein